MQAAGGTAPASLIVIDPAGHRSRVSIRPLPFRIGRQAGSELIVRDSRVSRSHARIVSEGADYVLEDAGSRHGVWVNGQRVERRVLRTADRIEFGVQESYQLVFAFDGAELARLMEQASAQDKATIVPGLANGPGGNLARLRAVLEVARTLERGFSLDDVLKSVVDAALAVTAAERGFVLLRQENGELEMRVARSRSGARLEESDLRIPRRVIRRALEQRRDLFSVNLDPSGGLGPEQSMADLELRSCVCVPLLRISTTAPEATSVFATGAETAGVLYLDSTAATADLTGGNRELLQSLAIEASTVLENARLLEEERAKQRMEEELSVARGIQRSLLPGVLPTQGWFRACGGSEPSHQVGGDYYDVMRIVDEDIWAAVVADVSGKGVSSALLASLLQGAFIATSHRWEDMPARMHRINRFLNDRTGGEKYVTMFYCVLAHDGTLHYVNAGHCAPLLVRASGALERLEPTGVPVGLMDPADFTAERTTLGPADKLVIYSDGVTDAQNLAGEFFGRKRLREVVAANARAACSDLHQAIQTAVSAFTGGAPQSDDLTLVVLEYAPE